jgi:uncharacterized protein YhdP
MSNVVEKVAEAVENVAEVIDKSSTETATGVVNEAKAKNKTQAMVKGMSSKLAKCKQVEIKIPIDKQNPKDTTVEVQINGYIFQIKRGVEVTVPLPVKKLLERGEYI